MLAAPGDQASLPDEGHAAGRYPIPTRRPVGVLLAALGHVAPEIGADGIR
jgi:hypothetical protein